MALGPGLIEFQNGRDAVFAGAAPHRSDTPDALSVAIDIHRAGRPRGSAARKLRPVLDGAVGIGCGIVASGVNQYDRAGLPIQFQPELDLAFARLRRTGELARVWNQSARSIEDLYFRTLKIRFVEQIESFRPELQPHPFTEEEPVLEK